MKLVDMKITDFLDELGSKSPAPGGGSVAALAGANAASLVIMVSELTINKRKFKALEGETQNEFKDLVEIFKRNKKLMTDYIDEDTKAFNLFMESLKLPKDTEEEKNNRHIAMQKATIESIKIPMKVCLSALESLRNMELIVKHANRNAICDLGVATLMFYSAYEGAVMNVEINLKSLDDEHVVKDYNDVILTLSNEVLNLKDDLLEEIKFLMK